MWEMHTQMRDERGETSQVKVISHGELIRETYNVTAKTKLLFRNSYMFILPTSSAKPVYLTMVIIKSRTNDKSSDKTYPL